MNAGPLIRTLALTRRAAARLAERTDRGALNRLSASCGHGATFGAGGCSCARRRAELNGCQRDEAVQRLVDCVKSRWRAPTQPSEPSQTAVGVAPGQHDTCRRITAHVLLQLSRACRRLLSLRSTSSGCVFLLFLYPAAVSREQILHASPVRSS